MSQLARRHRVLIAIVTGGLVSVFLGWSSALGSHSPPQPSPDPQWVSVRVQSEGTVPTLGGSAIISLDVRCPDPDLFSYWTYSELNVDVAQSNIVFGGVLNSAQGSKSVQNLDCTGDWETIEVKVPAHRGTFTNGRADVYAQAHFDGCCPGDEYIYDNDTDEETVTLRSRAVPVVVSID